MGRPRKALSEQKGNRTKAEIADRKYQEEESKVNRNLVPPNWLNDKARDIFENIVVELNEKKLLDNLDIPLLAIYSDSYARLTTSNVITILEKLKCEHNASDEKNTLRLAMAEVDGLENKLIAFAQDL